MDISEPNLLKHREILFAELHPDPNQAQAAAVLLTDVTGIHSLQPMTPTFLKISYDIKHISLEIIETALADAGLHLSNRIICKLKRSLYYYTEEVERANLGCPRGSSNCTQKVFINRYDRLHHGCRDQRPEHWRKYL